MKDSIDFGSMDISTLFRKLLVPTVLGMVFSAIFVITDGIFVGKGIGSDALAAVNITAPLFMIATGIGLMFGVGGSVVASIYLSQGKRKAANINITQALVFSTFIVLVMSALCFCFVGPLGCLLGSSDRLLPLVIEYMIWYLPFLVFYELLSTGMFFIRLDGSPNYAMMCNAIAAIFNIIFDYIFIFEFGWGMMGAAFATSLGTVVGGLMTVIYLTRFSRNIHLHRIKLSLKSLMLTLRNGGYMIKLGTSAFISEASIACMMFLGNYVFIHHLGEDGVAAFSIACYFFPIIFMVYNAIAQSAQPIISYNFGAGQPDRVRKALHLAIRTALICGISFFIITFLCRRHRLLPEHRTRSTSHHHHSSAGSGIHADRILCTSTCFRSTGNMVGCSVGRIVNDSLYYRNLFQRSLHGPPTISIFATWMHSLKNSATNIKYWKVTYRPY